MRSHESDAELADGVAERPERERGRLNDEMRTRMRRARLSMRRKADAAEDYMDELRVATRRNPFQSLAIAAGVGAVLGFVLGRLRGDRDD